MLDAKQVLNFNDQSAVGIDHEIGVSIAKLSMLTSDLPERSEGKSDVSMLNFAIDTTIEWSITILS